MALVRRILTHPEIYPHLSDDLSPAAEQYRPLDDPAIYYLAPREGEEVLGLFIVHPQTSTTYQGHQTMLPKHWGRGVEALKASIAWMWANTPAEKIMGLTPAYNLRALAAAKRAGMQFEGINRASYRKGGVLHDQIWTAIMRAE